MTTEEREELRRLRREVKGLREELLRDNELGWMIDMRVPPARAVPLLLEQLDRLTGEFRSRFRHEL